MCACTDDFASQKSLQQSLLIVYASVKAVAMATPHPLTWSHQHSPKLGSCVSSVYSRNSNPALMMVSSQTSRMMRACCQREGEGRGGKERREQILRMHQRAVERSHYTHTHSHTHALPPPTHTFTYHPNKWLSTNTSILSLMLLNIPFSWPGVSSRQSSQYVRSGSDLPSLGS